jgi:NAD+ synthase
MTAFYYLAALYSEIENKPYIVAGTGNKCETFVGYFTKGGDGVSDINVLGDLTVEEVIKIGEVLNVPDKVLYKTPDDGLSGMSDEDKLGVKYAQIEQYLEDKDKLEPEVRAKIEKLHNSTRHKFSIPTYRQDS